MNIDVELSEESLDEAIMAVQVYRDSLDQKASALVRDVTDRIKELAYIELTKHIETGDTIASLHTDYKMGATTARVIVGGAAVWLEFGTGVVANNTYQGAYVHPRAGNLGMMGIGDYGQFHGADPEGWWYYDQNGRRRHTFGIPATLFMWNSAQTAKMEIPNMARRLFRS